MILYEALKFYIRNLKTPTWITEEIRQQILNAVHEYYLQGEVLRWMKNGLILIEKRWFLRAAAKVKKGARE